MSDLHAAICQAVALMNVAPKKEIELIQAHNILREALMNYAEPAPQPVEAEGREANSNLVGWWNGILPDKTERSPYGPSVRWGADAENSGHDIPLYDGYNPVHYQTPPEQPAIDLEQFRPAVEATKRYGERLHAEGAFLPEQYDDWMEKADHLLALIDGAKALRDGGK